MHFSVAIVGAGPSGSLLAHILHLRGIECIVLEAKSRAYVEGRIRAGVLEQGTVDLLVRAGVGERLLRERMVHNGIIAGYKGEQHFMDFDDLADGKTISVYGQSEITKDLLAQLETNEQNVLYEAEVTDVEDINGEKVRVLYTHDGKQLEITADFVAGCDGYHGASRKAMPEDVLQAHEMVYPFGWLGIMADAPPSKEVALFSHHKNGFALLSMRSPMVSRLYLQCALDENLDEWPDDRIWDELDLRLGANSTWKLTRGPVTQKDVTPLRSFFAEPMQYGRLFLAGDAAHIVPPTGAKGLNSAVADISVLSAALIDHYKKGDETLLKQYSDVALRRNWQTQRFSWSNTTMFHVFPGSTSFQLRMQEAQVHQMVTYRSAGRVYAENHVGLPIEYAPDI